MLYGAPDQLLEHFSPYLKNLGAQAETLEAHT